MRLPTVERIRAGVLGRPGSDPGALGARAACKACKGVARSAPQATRAIPLNPVRQHRKRASGYKAFSTSLPCSSELVAVAGRSSEETTGFRSLRACLPVDFQEMIPTLLEQKEHCTHPSKAGAPLPPSSTAPVRGFDPRTRIQAPAASAAAASLEPTRVAWQADVCTQQI